MSESLNYLSGPYDSDEAYSLIAVQSAAGLLLGRKTRNFGKGKLVLPGGKDVFYLSGDGLGLVTAEECASRELQQETGLAITLPPTSMNMLYITDESEETKYISLHRAFAPTTQLHPSSEFADLQYYPENDLPYDEMPADYPLWLRHLIAGYNVIAHLQTVDGQVALERSSLTRYKTEPLGRLENVPLS